MVGLKQYVTGEMLKIMITSILVVLSIAMPAMVQTGNQTIDRWQVVFVTLIFVWILAIAMTHFISVWRKW